MTSALGELLVICLRHDRATGEAVQTSIALMDRRRRQLYQLVHGIAHGKVRPGHNLFIATVYEFSRYGQRCGMREINLGRGAPEQKVNLGANRLILLNHWLRNPAEEPAIDLIAARCRRSLSLDTAQPVFKGVAVQ